VATPLIVEVAESRAALLPVAASRSHERNPREAVNAPLDAWERAVDEVSYGFGGRSLVVIYLIKESVGVRNMTTKFLARFIVTKLSNWFHIAVVLGPRYYWTWETRWSLGTRIHSSTKSVIRGKQRVICNMEASVAGKEWNKVDAPACQGWWLGSFGVPRC
jgi:hypothetical protein